MEMLDDLGEVSMSADILQLYRESITHDLQDGKEDIPSYSEWKELNKEVLS